MKRRTFACNGASARGYRDVVRLDYQGPGKHRVRLGLPRFVTDLLHLPDRFLDLLEIAAYVFAADRSASRGHLDAVEYHSWARDMQFLMRVREAEFWADTPGLIPELAEALRWMTGDRNYRFKFQGGHSTPPANLFDAAGISLPIPDDRPFVMPFSGGLDSLAGALTLLEESDRHLILVSHRSSPRTKKTQDALVAGLHDRYRGRLTHYPFECTLGGDRGKEETQRSRSFLYASIAATIAMTYESPSIQVFENGVTSLNLARRQDLMNARSSRTTHPQSLGRLTKFFSVFSGQEFTVESPFLWKTKAEVIETVAMYYPELLSSSVSCTAAFKHLEQASHCGECFQCIDRRLASFAAGHEELDHRGLYSIDVTQDAFTTRSSQTTAVDYLRQAAFFQQADANELQGEYLKDISELLDWIPESPGDVETVERVHRLLNRHGRQVQHGLRRIRERVEDPFERLTEGSLLKLVADREHLQSEVERLADRLEEILREGIPRMFRTQRPKDEPDLNAKVNGLLATHYGELHSEHPATRFACASVIPDHELVGMDLLLEAKYVRDGTPPSKASEGISADLTKFPQEAFLLFLVLDLDRAVPDDREFVRDIEDHRPSRVVLIH